MNTRLRLFALVALIPPFVGAQEEGRTGLGVSASVTVETTASADADFGGFEAEVERDGLAATGSVTFGDVREQSFNVEVGAARAEYDWSGGGAGFVRPYDQVDGVSLGLRYTQALSGPWGIFGWVGAGSAKADNSGYLSSRVFPRSALTGVVNQSETVLASEGFSVREGDFSHSVTYVVAAGGSYAWSRTLSIQFGALVFTGINEDDEIWPLISVRWQATERLLVETAQGVKVTYQLDEAGRHAVDAGLRNVGGEVLLGQVEGRARELSGVGPAATVRREIDDERDLTADEDGWALEVGSTYTFGDGWWSGLSVRPFLHYTFSQEVEVTTGSDLLDEFMEGPAAPVAGLDWTGAETGWEVDGAFGGGVTVTWAF